MHQSLVVKFEKSNVLWLHDKLCQEKKLFLELHYVVDY